MFSLIIFCCRVQHARVHMCVGFGGWTLFRVLSLQFRFGFGFEFGFGFTPAVLSSSIRKVVWVPKSILWSILCLMHSPWGHVRLEKANFQVESPVCKTISSMLFCSLFGDENCSRIAEMLVFSFLFPSQTQRTKEREPGSLFLRKWPLLNPFSLKQTVPYWSLSRKC